MNQRPVTWQEVVLVFLGLALFGGAILAWVPDIQPGVREIGKWILAIVIPLMIIVAVSDYRRLHRKDLFPDVLATLVSPEQIFQSGDAHFAISGVQEGDAIRFVCLVQNLYDSENHFRLALRSESGGEWLAYELPELLITLPAGAVMQAKLHMPLRLADKHGALKLLISGRSGAARGRQIRFARRNAITMRVHPGVKVALLVTGHVVHGGGTFLTIPLGGSFRSQIAERDYAPAVWETVAIWQPGSVEEARRASYS